MQANAIQLVDYEDVLAWLKQHMMISTFNNNNNNMKIYNVHM